MPAANRGIRFYGWRIVGVAFVCHFISAGFLFYSYGVFFKAVAAELGGSRLLVSLGLTAVTVVSALCAPLVGRLAEAGKLRRLILFGAAMSAVGYALLTRVGALWQFHLVMALFVGAGAVSMGNIPPTAMVARWFVLHRGKALGIATMGVSLSGLIMPPVATWLIERVGWRGGFTVYAIATLLVVVPPAWLFIVNRPSDIGLRADGREPEDGPPSEERLWSTRAILTSRAFWTIACGMALTLFSVTAVLTHMVPYLTDRGFSAYGAATLLSAAAGAGVAGKFAFGAIADRTDPRYAVWLSLGLQLGGALVLIELDSGVGSTVAALLFGFGMGGVVPLSSVLTAAAFGGSYARAMGIMRPVMLPLSAAGVPFAGYMFDTYASYRGAFYVFAMAYALGALAIAAVPKRSVAQNAVGSEADLGGLR